MDNTPYVKNPASYRDPSGFIFTYNKEVYRQINKSYKHHFEKMISSGFYDVLVKEKKIIEHRVINENYTGDTEWFITIKPAQLAFVSYPCEWSFSMLKDAALLTIDLALKALDYGLVLKDASAFNVQLYKGQMTFIDTLSFEEYVEGMPWIAYRQFCEHFLCPLAIMHYTGLAIQPMLTAYPEGVPLAYAKSILPFKSLFNLHVYLHLHLHAAYASKKKEETKTNVPHLSKQKLVNLLKGLQAAMQSLSFTGGKTTWGQYYEEAATRTGYLEEKKAVIKKWIEELPDIKTVLDIGGNTGEFAALANNGNRRIICADGEQQAIDILYQKIKADKDTTTIPLVIDFANPTPAIGVNNQERTSFLSRASSDLAMALALIHHLAIGKNISFALIAAMCRLLGKNLIIEFVPKEDEKVKRMLQQKKDIYTSYSEEQFVDAFSTYFTIIAKHSISSSPRTLYLMRQL